MELYEIVKTEIREWYNENCYTSKPSIITATMDKDMAEQMLSIYRQNCGVNEAYDIRTVREPQIAYMDGYEHCKACNSFNTCVRTIREQPNTMIGCIRFGELKKYIEKDGNK